MKIDIYQGVAGSISKHFCHYGKNTTENASNFSLLHFPDTLHIKDENL